MFQEYINIKTIILFLSLLICNKYASGQYNITLEHIGCEQTNIYHQNYDFSQHLISLNTNPNESISLIKFPILYKPYDPLTPVVTEPIESKTVNVIIQEGVSLSLDESFIDLLNTIFTLSRIGYTINFTSIKNQTIPDILSVSNRSHFIQHINNLNIATDRILLIHNHILPIPSHTIERGQNIKLNQDQRLWLFKPSQISQSTQNLPHFLILHEAFHDYINKDDGGPDVHVDYNSDYSLFNNCSPKSIFVNTYMIDQVYEIPILWEITCQCNSLGSKNYCEYHKASSSDVQAYQFPLSLKRDLGIESLQNNDGCLSQIGDVTNQVLALLGTSNELRTKSDLESILIKYGNEKIIFDDTEKDIEILSNIHNKLIEASKYLKYENAEFFPKERFINNRQFHHKDNLDFQKVLPFKMVRQWDPNIYERIINEIENRSLIEEILKKDSSNKIYFGKM